MNRLAPLISRRNPPRACFRSGAIRAFKNLEETQPWLADAKLFAAGWAGGLVVFGTMIA